MGQGPCFGPQLGYTIPTTFLSGAGLPTELANVAETGLLLILSLHLVVAALSTIIFILSLFLHSHAVAIIALITAVVAAILGTVVFAADVALVVVVKDNIDSLFSGASFNVQFGNAVWMILAAMVLTWVAVVVLSARACYCCGVRRYVSECIYCLRAVLTIYAVQRSQNPRRRRSHRRRVKFVGCDVLENDFDELYVMNGFMVFIRGKLRQSRIKHTWVRLPVIATYLIDNQWCWVSIMRSSLPFRYCYSKLSNVHLCDSASVAYTTARTPLARTRPPKTESGLTVEPSAAFLSCKSSSVSVVHGSGRRN